MELTLRKYCFSQERNECKCDSNPNEVKELEKIEKKYAKWSTQERQIKKKLDARIGDIQLNVFFEQRKWCYGIFDSFIPSGFRPNTISVISTNKRIQCLFQTFFPPSSTHQGLRKCPSQKAEPFDLRFFETQGNYFKKIYSEESPWPRWIFSNFFVVQKEGCFLP